MTAFISGKRRRWEAFYKIAVLHLNEKQMKNVCEGVQFLIKLQASGLKIFKIKLRQRYFSKILTVQSPYGY